MSLFKKYDLYRDFAAGVYLSEAPPPNYTLYIVMYTYSHREGGEELNQREGYRGNSSQSWVDNTNMTDCIVLVYKL
jgi:hypothetical protein